MYVWNIRSFDAYLEVAHWAQSFLACGFFYAFSFLLPFFYSFNFQTFIYSIMRILEKGDCIDTYSTWASIGWSWLGSFFFLEWCIYSALHANLRVSYFVIFQQNKTLIKINCRLNKQVQASLPSCHFHQLSCTQRWDIAPKMRYYKNIFLMFWVITQIRS